MPFTSAVRLLVLLAVLAVLAIPADAFAAGTISTSSVTGRLVVPAGHPTTMRLHCPSSAVALNAAITSRGSGVAVLRSVPGKRAGGWAFRLAAAGSGSRSVSAVLRCVALQLPEGLVHARLNVRSRTTSGIELAPGATRFVRVGCGRNWTATGYALRDSSDTVRMAEVAPLAHEWRFTLENTGTSTARAGVSVRCLSTAVTARRLGGGSAQLRFGVTRRSFERAFPSGSSRRTATGGCGGSRFSVAAGLQLDPADPFEAITASPLRAGGARWTFRNVSQGDGFRAYMVCLSRTSAFH
jgi:hypothetical protein